MPHPVRGRISDDLASSDEIKTYKDEGEEEKRASENLLQEKNDLLFESERVEHIDKKNCRIEYNFSDTSIASGLSLMGYPFLNHANIPSSLYPSQRVMERFNPLYDSSLLLTPPPAHTRSSSWHLNLHNNKRSEDLRESSEKLNSTLNSNFWPLFNLPLPATVPQDTYNWYSPNSFANLYSNGWFLPGLPYPYVSPPPSILTKYIDEQIKQYNSNLHENHLSEEVSNEVDVVQNKDEQQLMKLDKSPHIKKPLNAFMIFMKEMRQKIMDECTLKESAAINQILGRKWHSLERSEQMRYYELAQKEKELHQQKYPTWSARDNYAIHTKKQRKKNRSNHKLDDSASDKECNVSKKM